MLPEFLFKNREILIDRCRSKIAARRAPKASEHELVYRISLLLDQLIHALQQESASAAEAVNPCDIARTSTQHGAEVLRGGFTVGQVVHDYRDLSQAVTELAVEQGASVTAHELRTPNRTLDEAIAHALTEFGRQRDQVKADESARMINERLGVLAHELRNLIGTAIMAVATMKKGRVDVASATGAVLDRSLAGLRDLVDRALVDVRLSVGLPAHRERLTMTDFIADVQAAVAMDAAPRDLELVITPIAEGVAVHGDRQILAAALTNLLQNALKFSPARGCVVLTVEAVADRVLIDDPITSIDVIK